MPLVQVSIGKGRSTDQLRELVSEVHKAVERTVDAKPDDITVIVNEVEPNLWARGNRTIEEIRAT